MYFNKHISGQSISLSRLHAVLPATHLVSTKLLFCRPILVPDSRLLCCTGSKQDSSYNNKDDFFHNVLSLNLTLPGVCIVRRPTLILHGFPLLPGLSSWLPQERVNQANPDALHAWIFLITGQYGMLCGIRINRANSYSSAVSPQFLGNICTVSYNRMHLTDCQC